MDPYNPPKHCPSCLEEGKEKKHKRNIFELGKEALDDETLIKELQDRIWECQSEEEKLIEKDLQPRKVVAE